MNTVTPSPLTVLSALELTNEEMSQVPNDPFMDTYIQTRQKHEALKQQYQVYETYKKVASIWRQLEEQAMLVHQLIYQALPLKDHLARSFRAPYHYTQGRYFTQNRDLEHLNRLLNVLRQELPTLIQEYQNLLEEGMRVWAEGQKMEAPMHKYGNWVTRTTPRARELAQTSMPGMKRKFDNLST